MSSSKRSKPQKPGRAASISDVARESGVSIFTVSAVVNNKSHVGKDLRERVENAIRKLNWPERRLRRLPRSCKSMRTFVLSLPMLLWFMLPIERKSRPSLHSTGATSRFTAAAAGIVRPQPFLDHTRKAWDDSIAVMLTAVFLLSQRAARQMVAQGGGGVILSTASANGHVAERKVAAYNAAKAGVVLLTQTMAIELAEHGIRAACVSPGYVGPTGLVADGGGSPAFFEEMAAHVPMGRIGRIEEVANLFCFLASDEASFISGASYLIDGAQLAEQR